VIARLGIRLVASLAGIAVGFLVSAALLDGFHISASALVEGTLVFWVVHLVVQFLALRVLIRQPSVAMAGVLALLSTVVSLMIVNVIVSGITISGSSTYVLTTLIIWVATVAGDMFGRRRIRARRALG
jgi:hypothetical protein